MDLEKQDESTRYAGKLHQAVLSLKPGDLCAAHQVHRMAKALALVEVMAARSRARSDLLNPQQAH